MHLFALAGLMHSGVRAFFSRHISAVLTRTRIGKINGCWRGPRIEVRDEPREGKREMEKNEQALLKSLEWRHAASAIILFGIIYRRVVLTRKSQSSENDIFLFSRFLELPRNFLRRSNYCGFITGINCARRLFGRLKLTTAIYLEHCICLPSRLNCRYWKYSFEMIPRAASAKREIIYLI